jgi:hypothetical protein
MHPQLDMLHEIVGILGWPALLAGLVWVIRVYDRGTRQVKDISADAAETKRMALETLGSLHEIKTNHLVHLQAGITQVATSNDRAVEVLQDISTGIRVLVDRTPRA